jgi:hypothetical protein
VEHPELKELLSQAREEFRALQMEEIPEGGAGRARARLAARRRGCWSRVFPADYARTAAERALHEQREARRAEADQAAEDVAGIMREFCARRAAREAEAAVQVSERPGAASVRSAAKGRECTRSLETRTKRSGPQVARSRVKGVPTGQGRDRGPWRWRVTSGSDSQNSRNAKREERVGSEAAEGAGEGRFAWEGDPEIPESRRRREGL